MPKAGKNGRAKMLRRARAGSERPKQQQPQPQPKQAKRGR